MVVWDFSYQQYDPKYGSPTRAVLRIAGDHTLQQRSGLKPERFWAANPHMMIGTCRKYMQISQSTFMDASYSWWMFDKSHQKEYHDTSWHFCSEISWRFGRSKLVNSVKRWWFILESQKCSHLIFRSTPWKINMEPTNHPFRKENDLPHPVPC